MQAPKKLVWRRITIKRLISTMATTQFKTFHLSGPKHEIKQSVWFGLGVSAFLFFSIPATQMISRVGPERQAFEETNIAYAAPETEEVAAEEAVLEEEEEPA